jgi:hypothetical protein
MMSDIQCPSCGTMNPDDLEFCQNCQTPLDSPDTFEPGEAPTKKGTAELEPILPQWLRDARSQARQSAEEDAEKTSQLAARSDKPVDLLAGLNAQGDDDDDEVPDWLGNITGKTGKGKKAGPGESTEVRWVELGGGTEELHFPGESIPAAQAPVPSSDENELPPWLANITAAQDQEDNPNQDTLTGWLRNTNLNIPSPDVEPPAVSAFTGDESGADAVDPFSFFESPSAVSGEESNTERLSNLSVEQSPAVRRPEGYAPLEAGLPDWLKGQTGGPGPTRTGDTGELPDWLAKLDTGPLPSVTPPPAAPVVPDADSESPDWLNSVESSSAEPVADASFPAASGTPDWLRNLGSEDTPDFTTSDAVSAEPASDIFADTPDWLKNTASSESSVAFPAADDDSTSDDSDPESDIPFETPDWLKNLGAETPPSPFAAGIKSEPATAADLPGGSPDWLKDLGTNEPAVYFTETPAGGQAGEADPSGTFLSSNSLPGETFENPASAFTQESADNAFSRESLSKGDLDALFMDMPDWLAATGAEEPGPAPTADNLNIIAPGSLPSWVEAMRPLESSAAQGGPVGDQSLEARGPLAGLQGVLPAVPFLGPSSKPKAYSLKLIASTEQQSHATLLDEVLAVETIPVPIATTRVVASQRMLRLGIAVLLFVVLAAAAFSGTQLFPLPLSTNVSVEVQRGLEAVWAIPENAPVLVVFDYEPALSGEMQTLASPLLDQMILLRHPRLTLLSTSPAGATLAESLFSGALAGHNYQSGFQYVNLGYLPGGLSGVRAFAQNPSAVSPFAFNGAPAWGSAPLQGVNGFIDFAAIIVLTDTAETGKIWIEQAGPLRGAAPMVIAASAQTGPLLHPYFQSGQINGLFTGLYDSAIIEQINAGRPGTARRYWDAYNLGLLLAVAVILGGSLFSLMMGLRERSEARAG